MTTKEMAVAAAVVVAAAVGGSAVTRKTSTQTVVHVDLTKLVKDVVLDMSTP